MSLTLFPCSQGGSIILNPLVFDLSGYAPKITIKKQENIGQSEFEIFTWAPDSELN